MGYQIFTGHRLETLVEAHRDALRGSFFGAQPVVVLQNQSLAQWLKLHFAESEGGWVTPDLVFQDQLLRRLIERAPATGEPVLFLDELKYRLYAHLSERLGRDPELAPLAGEGRPDPGRLFELADAVAGVFHEYAMNSTLWPQALASGQLPAAAAGDSETFAWQSRLWRDLLGSGKGTLAGLVLDRLSRQPPVLEGPPLKVVLIGSAFLSRRALTFLGAWASAGLISVTHLLLVPSPLPVEAWPSARPWSSWGAFGRAFSAALPAAAAAAAAAAVGPPGPGALGALQHALATGTAPPQGLGTDATVQVVSAPHRLRELEALRDALLTALRDPSLRVNDIAVLAPDIQAYAPFLETVFRSDDPGRDLRFHVIDLDLGRENAWFRALDALLALLSGPIDRPTLFALVDTQAFQKCRGLSAEDRDLWLEFTQTVSAWREDEPRLPQSWTAGADRFYASWFGAPTGAASGLRVSAAVFETVSALVSLFEELGPWRSQTQRPRPFSAWVRFFDDVQAAFLSSDEATGAALSGRLYTLAEAEDFVLPWEGFRAFVQDQIAHFPGRRGQLLTEGLHCSSLRPLRAIPFAFIAVLGLDEGTFPRRPAEPSFDLRRHEPGQEGGSLDLDRYTFWETLMAARSHLYLSYQGTSPVDGSPRPPSPVLADLLEFLSVDPESAVVKVSVKDFSSQEPVAEVWSPRTYRRLLAVAGPQTDEPEDAPLDDAAVDEAFVQVREADVVDAFVRPARFHLKAVQRVELRAEETASLDDEEPWSLPFLARQSVLSLALQGWWEGRPPQTAEALIDAAVAEGRAREGAFSRRDRRELEVRLGQLAGWCESLREAGFAVSPPECRPTWGGRPLSGAGSLWLAGSSGSLLPVILLQKAPPPKVLVEAALRVLVTNRTAVSLEALTTAGEVLRARWTPTPEQTDALAGSAQAYWRESARRPLPFYPDLLSRAQRTRQEEGLSWDDVFSRAFDGARHDTGGVTQTTLARDPYGLLAFPQEPIGLGSVLAQWWEPLFAPLLEAWTWE